MTVCIAAISMKDDKIVAVCDRLLSGDVHSIEAAATKILQCNKTWVVCYAGDPSHAEPLLNSAQSLVTEKSTTEEVIEAFRTTYRDHRIACVEQEILSAFGMTMKSFLSEGFQSLGDEVFAKTFEDMRSFNLNFLWLVAGWGGDRREIFTIENPGVVGRHAIVGAHAIGEGSNLALGHLYATYKKNGSILDVAYRALEAKFVAEATRSVGPSTFAYVLSKDGTFTPIPYADIDAMHRLWTAKRELIDTEIASKLTI
jgi:20S proteasome alpha/beta subunit